MRVIFTFLSGILLSLPVLADSTPADSWQQLVAQAAVAQVTSKNEMGLEYHSLSRLSSLDPTVSHQAEYFSVVGYTDSKGIFRKNRVEIVSEAWTVDANNIRTVEQWGYVVSLEGKLMFAMHQNFSEDTLGNVVKYTRFPVPADLEDPGLQAQLKAKIQEWAPAPSAQ